MVLKLQCCYFLDGEVAVEENQQNIYSKKNKGSENIVSLVYKLYTCKLLWEKFTQRKMYWTFSVPHILKEYLGKDLNQWNLNGIFMEKFIVFP